MPERDPNDVFLWRLSAMEEAMKYQSVELEKFRERQQELRSACDAIRRDYVGRADLREEFRSHQMDSRADWTLRVMALGVAVSTILSALGLILHH